MIDKLTPKYLNLEDDQRLVKSSEMTDALNVRLSSDQNGDGNVIKNAYGNTAVSFKTGDGLAVGVNQVIGSVVNSDGGEIFFFVWNSNNDHSIYRYSTASNEAQLVYRDSVLAFSSYFHIRASVVRNLIGETLLYFTDANNEPKKINVTRAILGLYPPAFTSGSDAEKLACIAIAKQPPMTPPTFSFSTNPLLKQNNLYESTFQFAAQYIYEDGERSAISPYSEIAISSTQFLDGIIDETEKLKNNTILISVPTSSADVDEIVVLARNGNAGAFYEIGTIVNDNTVSTQSISFDNSKLYTPISQDEVNKIYDNVPQTAEALTIAANRIVLGGYTEGYPNIKPDVDVIPNYYPQAGEYPIELSYPSSVGTTPANKALKFQLDVSNIPAVTAQDSLLNISIGLDLGRIQLLVDGMYIQWVQTDKVTQDDNDYAGLIDGEVNLSASPLSINKTINIPTGTVKADVITAIIDAVEGVYNVVLDSDVTEFDYATEIKEVKELQATTHSKPNKFMFFSGAGQISVELEDDTTSLVRFRMRTVSAVLSAKKGYNFNTGNILNVAGSFPPLRMLSSLFTRGEAINEAFPATNRLFNEIRFVDVPSVIYKGDLELYNKYTGTSVSGDVLSPTGLSTTVMLSLYLTLADDLDTSEYVDASFLSSGDVGGYSTFKAGATHSFGLVYYDQFNRNGGVQPIEDMYVNWFDNRFIENSLYGRTDTVFRVKHNPPSWAVRWAPVYAPINSITQKFQYSIIQAFTATNLSAKPFAGISSFQETTYLSLRSLEGKNDSYKEGLGANLEYVFQEGDRMRIIQYGYFQRSTIDLEVLGYFEFIDDVDTNPIIDLTSDENKFSTTGKFLAVRSTNLTGWDNYSVINETDNWKNECIIEVYRQNRPASEQIFYEIGESFPIVAGVHVGQRTVVSQFSVEVVDDSDRNNLEVHSNVIAYKGDILTDGSGRTLIVGNVYPEVNGIYNYVFFASTISGSFSATTYTLNITNSSDAVVQTSNGDAYYRPRKLKIGQKAYANNYKLFFVEDYSASDFFTSKSTSIGRPHVVQPNASTVFRKASVTYSDAFIVDSQYLGLSSFNPSLANFYDFEYRHGSIKQLIGDDDRMYVIQERKAGWAPVGRNIIESTEGVQSITLSRNVIGVANYYQGDYGINNNPESLSFDRGKVYFCDVRSGKVIRISRDGISLISEEYMDAFFKDKFKFITSQSSFKKVVCGTDLEADEYIISVGSISNADVSVTDGVTTYTYNVQTTTSGTSVVAGVEFDDDDLFTFNTEIREFQDLCDEFDDSLNAIVYLDKIIDGQPVYVGEEFIGQSGLIYGVATNTSYDFFVTISLNLSTGEFTFTNACGDFSATIGSSTALGNDFTVGYDLSGSVWNTFYSYRPESIACVDDTLFTFYLGTMYKHDDSALRSTYYGTSYDTSIEVISNLNPSMVKSYESISLEGTSAWAAEVTNTDQSATILSSDFSERERNWYAYVPRDSSANTGTSTITALSGTSEVFVLGDVATGGVSGSTITFTTPIGDIPFPIGASLYRVSGSTLVSLSLTVASISGDKQITASGSVAGVSNGDTIVVIANGAIEGDQIRDYYAKVKLTNSSTSEIELYAVNMVFAKSNLHNQLGQ